MNQEIPERYLQSITPDAGGWSDPQARLKTAFINNEFILYSQSILKLTASGDKRTHFEIFVRLQEEEQNLTPPGTFLPILEDHNLGPLLDRYVLRQVLAWCRLNRQRIACVMHINLCFSTLLDVDFPAFVETELKAADCAGDSLCFEIPGAEISYEQGTRRFTAALRRIGCHVAVGSSESDHVVFEPLCDLTADFLKIGGRLIRDLTEDPVVAAEVQTTIRACRAFGIQTIATYVESPRTLDVVRNLQANYAQGYGISKPEPLDNLVKS